jgi:hypothetical protein
MEDLPGRTTHLIDRETTRPGFEPGQRDPKSLRRSPQVPTLQHFRRCRQFSCSPVARRRRNRRRPGPRRGRLAGSAAGDPGRHRGRPRRRPGRLTPGCQRPPRSAGAGAQRKNPRRGRSSPFQKPDQPDQFAASRCGPWACGGRVDTAQPDQPDQRPATRPEHGAQLPAAAGGDTRPRTIRGGRRSAAIACAARAWGAEPPRPHSNAAGVASTLGAVRFGAMAPRRSTLFGARGHTMPAAMRKQDTPNRKYLSVAGAARRTRKGVSA